MVAVSSRSIRTRPGVIRRVAFCYGLTWRARSWREYIKGDPGTGASFEYEQSTALYLQAMPPKKQRRKATQTLASSSALFLPAVLWLPFSATAVGRLLADAKTGCMHPANM